MAGVAASSFVTGSSIFVDARLDGAVIPLASLSIPNFTTPNSQ
jgi:hypothetical protein